MVIYDTHGLVVWAGFLLEPGLCIVTAFLAKIGVASREHHKVVMERILSKSGRYKGDCSNG